ncbi:MAG: DUF1003 domain-containing protein [archaeon]
MKKEEIEKIQKLKDKLDFVQTIHPIFKSPRTFGQKSADWITRWAGSWIFIIGFFFFLILWMYVNVTMLHKYNLGEPWDPYPFILLNLVLSCLAAIQAPIILMSQNRENQRDRQRAQYDYAINKKAEREIREIKNLLRRKYKKK